MGGCSPPYVPVAPSCPKGQLACPPGDISWRMSDRSCHTERAFQVLCRTRDVMSATAETDVGDGGAAARAHPPAAGGAAEATWRPCARGWSAFDELLPAGGLPLGQVVELWGEAASRRTSLALRAVGVGAPGGRLCAYVDGPWELYPPAAMAAGVDPSATADRAAQDGRAARVVGGAARAQRGVRVRGAGSDAGPAGNGRARAGCGCPRGGQAARGGGGARGGPCCCCSRRRRRRGTG